MLIRWGFLLCPNKESKPSSRAEQPGASTPRYLSNAPAANYSKFWRSPATRWNYHQDTTPPVTCYFTSPAAPGAAFFFPPSLKNEYHSYPSNTLPQMFVKDVVAVKNNNNKGGLMRARYNKKKRHGRNLRLICPCCKHTIPAPVVIVINSK